MSTALRQVSNVISVFSYLARGVVEKLEVVNKKWVRVRLTPGNSVNGSVSVEWNFRFACRERNSLFIPCFRTFFGLT